VDIGSSYLPSELQAAYLWAQLEHANEINESRLNAWHYYWKRLQPLAEQGRIELATIPEGCSHNAHMFYMKTSGLDERTALLDHLKSRDIFAVFHYVPLHSARAGAAFGRLHGKDSFTTNESERLVRLPMWFGIDEATQQQVVDAIIEFYR